MSPPLCDETAAHLHVGKLTHHHWFLTFQVVWLRGAEAGKHNRQRQPPLRRAGPRPACQRHRQLRLEDDRLAEAMSADDSPWHLFCFVFYFWQFNYRLSPLPFFDLFVNECKRMKEAEHGRCISALLQKHARAFLRGRTPDWIRGSAGWGRGYV